MRADCVVVGGGFAGIVAANRLAQLGRRAVVLERGAEPGGMGNARISGGMLHVAWAPMTAPAERLERHVNEVTDGHADPGLVRALAGSAGRALGWLGEQGIALEGRGTVDFASAHESVEAAYRVHALAPRLPWQVGGRPTAGRGPNEALRRLHALAAERGCDVRLDATVVDLAPAGASGWQVRYRSADAEQRVATGAVLVADGGFQANREMLSRYVGANAADALQRCTPGSTGSGLRLLVGLGAGTTGLGRVYGHMVSRSALHDDGLWPFPALDDLCLRGLLVDRYGRRVPTAASGGVQLVNELIRTDDPRGCTAVIDDRLWREADAETPYGAVGPNPWVPRRGGLMYQAGSLPELAAEMSVPAHALVAAAEEHAAQPDRKPLATAPFHALPVVPGITFTMGGVTIAPDGGVLDQDGARMPGLWAAGGTAGGLQGGPRGGYIGGLSVALVFGLLAAEAIAGAAGASGAAT